ncbi:MAG: hypothetical protein KDA89_02850 [Planctomycetaceae bacterium]|nr:hypothetical protein [Planctomycetaceae bacterium]
MTSIERASVFQLGSYRRNDVARLQLDAWVSAEGRGERRHSESVHDCLTLLHKINAPDVAPAEASVSSLKAVLTFAEEHPLPTSQRLGESRFVVVQISGGGLSDADFLQQIGEAVFGTSVTSANVMSDGTLVQADNRQTLLLVCETSQLEAVVRLVYGPLRLLETLCHKIVGQFDEYRRNFREPLLSAADELQNRLHELQSRWRTTPTDAAGRQPTATQAASVVRSGQQVTEAYTRLLMAESPVQQTKTMLLANLQNLEQLQSSMADAAANAVIRQRANQLPMLRAQVEADLGVTKPLLEAARCVTQTFHSQMLAEVAAGEAESNRRQSDESRRREQQNLRLVLIGLWIGCNELVAAWLNLNPSVSGLRSIAAIIWTVLTLTFLGIGWRMSFESSA